jgi:uncharacterized membrane protein YcaP (DUF421 family)
MLCVPFPWYFFWSSQQEKTDPNVVTGFYLLLVLSLLAKFCEWSKIKNKKLENQVEGFNSQK